MQGLASNKQAMPGIESAYEKHAADEHKRVSRMLGFTLTRGDAAAWSDFSWLIHNRLAQKNVAGIAWAALGALSEENAIKVSESTIGGAGYPLAPLFPDEVAEDANWWGDHASITEQRAYTVAGYKRLSARDRRLIAEHFENRWAA